MDILKILKESADRDLTSEEEFQLTQELSEAYHQDEASVTSRDVQRIAEKIRAKLNK